MNRMAVDTDDVDLCDVSGGDGRRNGYGEQYCTI